MKQFAFILIWILAGWGISYILSRKIIDYVSLHARSVEDIDTAAFWCIFALWPALATLGGFVGYRLYKGFYKNKNQ
jgi:hypothetical protein